MICPYCGSESLIYRRRHQSYECDKCGFFMHYSYDGGLEAAGYMYYQFLRRKYLELKEEYEVISKRLSKIKRSLELASDKIKRKALAEEL